MIRAETLYQPGQSTIKETLAFPLALGREGRALQASLGFAFGSGYDSARKSAGLFLHPNEESRWNELKFPLRQKSYLLGRRAAKAALAVCYPFSPATEIEICNGVFNQPFLSASAPVSAELSLAHAPDAAVALVCPEGHPSGVDLELVSAERASAASACFAPQEAPILASLSLPESTATFLLWSVKEALGKALRCGLAVPFDVLAIKSVEARDGAYESHFEHFPPFRALSWTLGDHILSIVIPKRTTLAFAPTPELVSLIRAPAATKC